MNKKYEYTIEEYVRPDSEFGGRDFRSDDELITIFLDKLGAEGWELVNVKENYDMHHGLSCRFYFKIEKVEEEE